MEIKELENIPSLDQNKKLSAFYIQFELLLKELRLKELPNETVIAINNEIDQVNAVSKSVKEWGKQLKNTQTRIVKLIEKKHKLVTKNYYKNMWLALGMAAFGIPLGIAFGASLGNMAFLAIGLPIGMVIGMAMGTKMDKKAFDEGRQIDLELKY